MQKKLTLLLSHRHFIRLISLGDQVFFAGGNFLFTILLTRFFKDTELAAYGIALSIALTLQSVLRNCYVVQNALLPAALLRKRGKRVLAEQIISTFPLLFILIIAAGWTVYLADGSLPALTLVASVACFAIYSQLEFERVVFMKYGKFFIPFLTSFAYALLSALLLYEHGRFPFISIMGFMLVFALCKSLILIFVIGMPDFKGGRIMFRSDLRRNFAPSIQGVMGYAGFMHAPVLLLGMLSTPREAAAYVAMRGLMSPLQIIIRSMDIMDKNFFREKSRNSSQGIKDTMITQVTHYALLSGAFAVAVCIFHTQMVHWFYGGKYTEFRTTLYGWALATILFAALQPVESAIIVKKLLNRYNIARLWIGTATCLFVLLTVKNWGSEGAVFITLVASLAGVLAGLYLVETSTKKTAGAA